MKSPTPPSPSFLVQAIRTFHLTIKLLLSSKVPSWTKVVPLLALAYVLFPFDFLPDIIPGLGQLDDLTVVLLFLWTFMQLVPQEIVRDVRGDSKIVEGDYKIVTDDKPTASPQDQITPPDQTR